jgi:phosphoglycolate phosphatase
MRDRRGAVVFDLDGTLVDTSGDIVAAVNHVRALVSLPPLDLRAVLAEVGFGATYLIERTMDTPDAAAVPERVGEFRRYYREHQGAASVIYPGVRPMIDELAAEFDLYVLSNKPHEAAVREIEIQGLGDAFRRVWGAGSLPALKPDPAGVREALLETGVGADRGAMVGDMAIDVATGAAAGVHSFLVSWGFKNSALETAAAGAPGTFASAASPERLAVEIRCRIPARS